jgi:hypothetical protein
MGTDDRSRRRWFGAIVLAGALILLILGETLLKDRLRNVTFVLYWLLCFILTGAAIVVAFRDAQALRRETRQEHRELVEDALKEVESKARAKKRDGSP